MKKLSWVLLLSLISRIAMAVGKAEAMDSFSTHRFQHDSLKADDGSTAKGDVYAGAEYKVNDIHTSNTTDNPIENVARNLKEMMNMLRGTYECLMKRINLLKYELNLLYQNITEARYRATVVDCSDMLEITNKSGYFTLYMDTGDRKPLRVYCDLDTEGGGWTVIQVRRPSVMDVTFDRKWNEYFKGFGSPDTQQFVGISNLYTWMLTRMYELRVNVRDHEGEAAYAKYERFHLEGEHCGYRMMQFVSSGPAGDSLEFAISIQIEESQDEIYIRHGMKFSTSDRDYTTSNCSQEYKSGWWFNDDCGKSNLNGPYLGYGEHDDGRKGIWWKTFRKSSLHSCTMMIRPRYPINTIFHVLFKPIYLDV
ncbi:angiopoietin-1-like [Scylla paramamosain]|uniref:angiopoietin-1-like n=1 Tax=Scylla paramamosain TaxID=85552 RepID=UPI00308277B0